MAYKESPSKFSAFIISIISFPYISHKNISSYRAREFFSHWYMADRARQIKEPPGAKADAYCGSIDD
jgi:hypothetical protein